MLNLKLKQFLTITFLGSMLIMSGCGDDDSDGPSGPMPTGNTQTYSLSQVSLSTITGTARFIELDDGSTDIELVLQNTPSGGTHPAHIHMNAAAAGGPIVITLETVNGDTGESRTNVTQTDNGTAISYNQLISYDGHINVHLSEANLSTLIAQGDIGSNILTGESKTYTLNEKDVAGISGTAEFAERMNGTTLITLRIENTVAGDSHPAHIHNNDAATGGPIAISLTSVDGAVGESRTQISETDGGDPITYEQLLEYDGYINVHKSNGELGVIIAQGNIGSNEGLPSVINYNVTANGMTAYVFNGGGLTDADNPDLTLTRGETYTFTVSAAGHPFYIKSVQGTTSANAYDTGVTNNGSDSGTVTFVVPAEAPETLYYNCGVHSPMTGTITIVD